MSKRKREANSIARELHGWTLSFMSAQRRTGKVYTYKEAREIIKSKWAKGLRWR